MRSSLKATFSAVILCSAAFGNVCPTTASCERPSEIALREHQLGLSAYAEGNIEEAEAHYIHALSAWEQADESYKPQQVVTLIGLGRLYQATQRYSDAAKVLVRGLDIARSIEGAEPKLMAVALSRLGGLYSISGTVQEARSVLTEAIAKLSALQPLDQPELAYAYNSLGMTELRAGSYPLGESNLRQAVTIAINCLGEEDQQTAIYQTNLGLALYLQGEYSRALPLLRRAEFVLESKPNGNSFQLGTALAEISVAEVAQGKFFLAEDDARRALAVFKLHFAPKSSEVARAQVNLAAIYLVENKTSQAAEILPAAVATERSLLGNGRALANGIRWLAQLRAQQRQWREAESLYREAIQMYEADSGLAPSEIGAVRREFAKVLKQDHGKELAGSPAM